MTFMKNVLYGVLVNVPSFAAEQVPLPESLIPPSITLGQYVDTLCVGDPLEAGGVAWGDMTDSFASWYRLNANKLKAGADPMGDLPFFLETLRPVVDLKQILHIEYSMPIPGSDNSQGEPKIYLQRGVIEGEGNYFEGLFKKTESPEERQERQNEWIKMYGDMKEAQQQKSQFSTIESIRGSSERGTVTLSSPSDRIYPSFSGAVPSQEGIQALVSSNQVGRAPRYGFGGGFSPHHLYSSRSTGVASLSESRPHPAIQDPQKFLNQNFNSRIGCLNMAYKSLADEMLEAILTHSIPLSLQINRLVFCDNKLTAQGIEILSRYLPGMTNLKVLWLDGNNIQDEGLGILQSHLKYLPSLEKLSISSNHISSHAFVNLLPDLPPKIGKIAIGDSLDENGRKAYRAAGFKPLGQDWIRERETPASLKRFEEGPLGGVPRSGSLSDQATQDPGESVHQNFHP